MRCWNNWLNDKLRRKAKYRAWDPLDYLKKTLYSLINCFWHQHRCTKLTDFYNFFNMSQLFNAKCPLKYLDSLRFPWVQGVSCWRRPIGPDFSRWVLRSGSDSTWTRIRVRVAYPSGSDKTDPNPERRCRIFPEVPDDNFFLVISKTV